jgi:hypothetical protein
MKMIYFGIILILINIWYLLTRSRLSESFFNKTTIAVVGNGQLSEKDREKINNHDIICRFNDVKNHNFLDRTDILFVRQDGSTGKIHGLNNYATNIRCKELVFIGSWNEHYENLKAHNNTPINIINIYEDHCSKESSINKCILNDNADIIFENKKHVVPHTACYLSSGTLAISYLLEKFPEANLEIFGMNWAFQHAGHPKIFEKNLIAGCKRCNINYMKNNKY